MAISSGPGSSNSDSQSLLDHARQEKIRGEFASAIASRVRADAALRREEASLKDIALNLNQISNLAVHIGNMPLAEVSAREALDIVTALNKSIESIATFQMMLSCILAEQRRFREALEIGLKALEFFERVKELDRDFLNLVRQDLHRMSLHDPGPYIERRK